MEVCNQNAADKPNEGGPVILVPARFLRSLPQLDASDFWSSTEAAQLRANFNYDVMTKVPKKEIGVPPVCETR